MNGFYCLDHTFTNVQLDSYEVGSSEPALSVQTSTFSSCLFFYPHIGWFGVVGFQFQRIDSGIFPRHEGVL